LGYDNSSVPVPSPQKKWYTLTVDNHSTTEYTLTATPIAGGPQKDDAWGTYTLKSTGQRESDDDVTKCWGSACGGPALRPRRDAKGSRVASGGWGVSRILRLFRRVS